MHCLWLAIVGRMHTPPAFCETEPRRLAELIRQHPFATLIAVRDDGAPEIAHVPVFHDPTTGTHGTLLGHVGRSNPMARLAVSNRPLVAVFHGPHAYVSASWYVEPSEQVPTWNYAMVHAHGRGRALDGVELRALLAQLAGAHDTQWRVDSMNQQLLEELTHAIVGFAIPIDTVEGTFKLSQNRSSTDRARVESALRARGTADDEELAQMMRARAEPNRTER